MARFSKATIRGSAATFLFAVAAQDGEETAFSVAYVPRPEEDMATWSAAEITDKARAIAVAHGLVADPADLAVPDTDYREERASAYPPIGDQLDALWKQLNQDRLGGKSLIQEVDTTLNTILAVKAQYPKPGDKEA